MQNGSPARLGLASQCTSFLIIIFLIHLLYFSSYVISFPLSFCFSKCTSVHYHYFLLISLTIYPLSLFLYILEACFTPSLSSAWWHSGRNRRYPFVKENPTPQSVTFNFFVVEFKTCLCCFRIEFFGVLWLFFISGLKVRFLFLLLDLIFKNKCQIVCDLVAIGLCLSLCNSNIIVVCHNSRFFVGSLEM